MDVAAIRLVGWPSSDGQVRMAVGQVGDTPAKLITKSVFALCTEFKMVGDAVNKVHCSLLPTAAHYCPPLLTTT